MRQFLFYSLNGLLNTAVTYTLFLMLIHFVDYRLAIVAVYAVGICLSYALNRTWVFVQYGNFYAFVAVSLGLMLVNMNVTSLLVEQFGWPVAQAQLCSIVVVFLVGFIVNKRFVFTRARVSDSRK